MKREHHHRPTAWQSIDIEDLERVSGGAGIVTAYHALTGASRVYGQASNLLSTDSTERVLVTAAGTAVGDAVGARLGVWGGMEAGFVIGGLAGEGVGAIPGALIGAAIGYFGGGVAGGIAGGEASGALYDHYAGPGTPDLGPHDTPGHVTPTASPTAITGLTEHAPDQWSGVNQLHAWADSVGIRHPGEMDPAGRPTLAVASDAQWAAADAAAHYHDGGWHGSDEPQRMLDGRAPGLLGATDHADHSAHPVKADHGNEPGHTNGFGDHFTASDHGDAQHTARDSGGSGVGTSTTSPSPSPSPTHGAGTDAQHTARDSGGTGAGTPSTSHSPSTSSATTQHDHQQESREGGGNSGSPGGATTAGTSNSGGGGYSGGGSRGF